MSKKNFVLERHELKVSSEKKAEEKGAYREKKVACEMACVVLTSAVRKGAFILLLAITQR